MKISRKLAIKILKYCFENKNFYFPFLVVCREYPEEDGDFVEIYPDEWEYISGDEKYKTFELWENLQNLYTDTTELLSKGFIDKIVEAGIKKYLIYTPDGYTKTLQNNDIENLQILDFLKGKNINDAVKIFKNKRNFKKLDFKKFIIQEVVGEELYF